MATGATSTSTSVRMSNTHANVNPHTAATSHAPNSAPPLIGDNPTHRGSTSLQKLESHLAASLTHLWTSAIIVEEGVAPMSIHTSNGGGSIDPMLERILGSSEPKVDVQQLTNQNMQQQMSDITKKNDEKLRTQLKHEVQHPSNIHLPFHSPPCRFIRSDSIFPCFSL